MPYDPLETKQCLISKFQFSEVPETRHDAVTFFVGDKKVASVRFSRGSRHEIDDSLMTPIVRQARVGTLNFFKQMMDCTKDLDDYIDRLRDGKFLE